MSKFLGIDTSNYTTSTAIFENGKVTQSKMLLPVKSGDLGVRQSDAVFHHTRQLPMVFSELNLDGIDAIGVSTTPTNSNKSYMPCFLAGKNVADVLGMALGKKVYYFSHQQGHIAAALYSANMLDECLNKEFIAFHLSGGTSECLYVRDLLKGDTEVISQTLDLNAGQAVDRVGVMLGLNFPCGKELDELSKLYDGKIKVKTSVKNLDFCLSGVENQCKKLFENGESKEFIARFCLEFITVTLEKVIENIKKEYGDLPVIFSGGVSSNSLIQNRLNKKFGAVFAEPVYSCDNAAGTAILSFLSNEME